MPHSLKKGLVPIDDGQLYDSTISQQKGLTTTDDEQLDDSTTP